MAEEEQAAAEAAAKKAKKLRQKLKAKKQAQLEAAASAAESHLAHTPSDEAQPLLPESSQLTMDLPELSSSSAVQHQAQDPQGPDLDQQQQQQHQHQHQHQQQLDEAVGTSLSVSSAVGAAAAQKKDAKAVAVELGGLHLPSCDQAANKSHTDADFLQQLFCCSLTKVDILIGVQQECSSVVFAIAQQHMQCLRSWLYCGVGPNWALLHIYCTLAILLTL